MKFTAEINIMPLKALLDPQGKAVVSTMNNVGYKTISNVRIGKHITLEIEAADKDQASSVITETCKKMLTNPIMEDFEFILK